MNKFKNISITLPVLIILSAYIHHRENKYLNWGKNVPNASVDFPNIFFLTLMISPFLSETLLIFFEIMFIKIIFYFYRSISFNSQ